MQRSASISRKGVTFIEIIIAVAMIAIILAMALPAFSNYSIKAVIKDSLSVASSAKTSIIYACQKDPGLTHLSRQAVGYHFQATKHIFDIELGGDCTAPTITMTLQATGARTDPVLTISGNIAGNSRRISWNCESDNPEVPLPDSC